MKASVRALLTGAVDYAGLFPPAELSLDESIRNYARYRQQSDAWMLGRFICPATRLKELEPYVTDLFPSGAPLAVSALGRGGKTPEEFITGFGRDMEAVVSFETAVARAVVDVFETRLPPVPQVAFDFDSARVRLFFESTPAADWQQSFTAAMDVAMSTGHGSGFKLRTGGIEASAFPTSEHIARAIALCRARSLPIKFTAGLHHPVRHFNGSVGTKMHGFINVFVAGVLAYATRRSPTEQQLEQLLAILDEEDAASFEFSDESLRWKDHRATIEQIDAVRRDHVISFGSCSFDEPRDDLRGLGWL